MKDLILSQTCVKDLEKDSTCPARWKGMWIDKTISFPANEHMEKGHYFEYLAIGGSAKEEEPPVTDLKRNKDGSKSVAQKRIESQAKRFQKLVDKQGFKIEDVQVVLLHDNERGVVDFTVTDKEGNFALADLKLTADVTNTRTQYGWGNPIETLDLLQAGTYSRLHKELHPDEYEGYLPFYYFVFDYTPRMQYKIIKVNISELGAQESEERFNTAREVVGLYNENGWTKIPSLEECEGCPLKCDMRYKHNVEIEEFNF